MDMAGPQVIEVIRGNPATYPSASTFIFGFAPAF